MIRLSQNMWHWRNKCCVRWNSVYLYYMCHLL